MPVRRVDALDRGRDDVDADDPPETRSCGLIGAD